MATIVSACMESAQGIRRVRGMVEAVAKLHLASKGCVAIWFKILTYLKYAPLLNRIDALPLNAIYNFETASDDLLRSARANPQACLAEVLETPRPFNWLHNEVGALPAEHLVQ